MEIRNIFLLVIQLFMLLLTSVCVIFCETPIKQFEPYVLSEGFNTVLSPHFNITIQDVVTNSDKLREHECVELRDVPVLTVIKELDETVAVVGISLGYMGTSEHINQTNRLREVVSHVKKCITDNNGVVFPAKVFDRSTTRLLPVFVVGMQDIELCEEILRIVYTEQKDDM